jgi:hypothetical protein
MSFCGCLTVFPTDFGRGPWWIKHRAWPTSAPARQNAGRHWVSLGGGRLFCGGLQAGLADVGTVSATALDPVMVR